MSKYPTTPPSASEVMRLSLQNGQPPKWWVKSVRPDDHGNEWAVVPLRVFDGEVHAIWVAGAGWEPLDIEPGALYWVLCPAPSPAGVE